MKYSIGNLTFEAKTSWEATRIASNLMHKNKMREGKLIGHYKNGDYVVCSIIIPQP